MNQAFVLCCCASLLLGRSALAGDSSDAKTIQGDWVVEELLIAGVHTEKDASPGQKLSIDAKRIVLKYKDGTKREMTYTLDPSTTPKSIDVNHVEIKGQPKEQAWLGIYKLSGDELILSLENGGPVRAQLFEPAGDSGIVYKLRREKPHVNQ